MYEFCKGGGCTAKLGPGILDKVLKNDTEESRSESSGRI